MKISKRVFAIIMCFVLVLCSGCNKTESSKKENKSKKIVIKVVYPTSRAMGEKDINQFEKWFSQNYPDAKLDLVSSAVTTVTDTVKSEFKNDNPPDIFVTTEYDTFVDEGYLADITGTEAVTKYRKSSVRNLERNGKVYALPLGGGTLTALHYNKTLFDKYHLEYPKTNETLNQLLNRVSKVINSNDLKQRAVGASLLYPSQAVTIINSALAQKTQNSQYLKWISSYGDKDVTFKDKVFQDYLNTIDIMMNEKEDSDGNVIPNTGNLFSRDDFFSTQASAISSFLNGSSFMYIGDVTRCYNAFGTEGIYGKDDIAVMGVPVGLDGVSYVSYTDELYMGVNSKYDSFSDRKKEIISDILNHISSDDDTTRNIFTFTDSYTSVYLEGKAIERKDDKYFYDINKSLDNNYISQEVNNTSFSSVFGKIIIAWKKEQLADIIKDGDTDIDKATEILEKYRTKKVNAFEKSEKPIGKSKSFMEYQSNIIRTQETAIGNQVADMARDYMKTDFSIINAGAIRASIPKGDISVQTLNSVLPYENYLVKIKVKGSTLKKAIANAYNVGPTYKSGQFGDISGLKVNLETDKKGYAQYSDAYNKWKKKNSNASEIKKNIEIKNIVEDLCGKDANCLNLQVKSITDLDGNEIEDEKDYTVAILDYLLKNEDGYDMLGVLSDCKTADRSIKIFDREDNEFTGTVEEMTKKICETCDKGADAFVKWVKDGNDLSSSKDGRISIDNFIYIE